MTQYRFTLRPEHPCAPQPEWAYRLYAALLALVPDPVADALHRDAVTPVSQFLTIQEGEILWTVSLLGESSERAFGPVLEGLAQLSLQKERVTFRAERLSCRTIPDVETLLDLAQGAPAEHRFRVVTPTAFKSRKRYLALPTSRLILQNLLRKWNGCFPDCPIEDEDGQGLDALAAALQIKHFRIQDSLYHIKGSPIPGFTGDLTLATHASGFHRQLTHALLLFAGYAGLGIKTALGMGGITIIS